MLGELYFRWNRFQKHNTWTLLIGQASVVECIRGCDMVPEPSESSRTVLNFPRSGSRVAELQLNVAEPRRYLTPTGSLQHTKWCFINGEVVHRHVACPAAIPVTRETDLDDTVSDMDSNHSCFDPWVGS